MAEGSHTRKEIIPSSRCLASGIPSVKSPWRRRLRASLCLTASVRGDSMDGRAYAHGRFLDAIEHLATGPDDVKRRLYDAYFSLLPVQEDDLPHEVRKDFRWVIAQLTKRARPTTRRAR